MEVESTVDMTINKCVEGGTIGSDAKIYLIQRAHFFFFTCTQQPPDSKELRIHIPVFLLKSFIHLEKK